MKVLSLNLIRSSFLMLMLMLVLAPGSVKAQSVAEKVTVRYAGMQNEHLVFYAAVENELKERCSFIIRDGSSNILFEERFTQQKFTKKILLPVADLKDVRFEVTGKGSSYQRQFVISTRIVEEVSVEETM